MTSGTLFLVILGAAQLTSGFFRILEAIEAPPKKRRNHT